MNSNLARNSKTKIDKLCELKTLHAQRSTKSRHTQATSKTSAMAALRLLSVALLFATPRFTRYVKKKKPSQQRRLFTPPTTTVRLLGVSRLNLKFRLDPLRIPLLGPTLLGPTPPLCCIPFHPRVVRNHIRIPARRMHSISHPSCATKTQRRTPNPNQNRALRVHGSCPTETRKKKKKKKKQTNTRIRKCNTFGPGRTCTCFHASCTQTAASTELQFSLKKR